MRQRKVKDLNEKIRALEDYLVVEPEKWRGSWRELFGNDNPIRLEIGCGKGQFLCTHAKANPEINYIGIEGQDSVVLRALEKAAALESRNVLCICQFVNDIGELFAPKELDKIYLNFSDPWPKGRHAKRRLTYHKRLLSYFTAMTSAGEIEIKTDNDDLFEFTMDEIRNCDFDIIEYTRDLHASSYDAREITTEYEDKFKSIGKNINYVKIKRLTSL